MYSNAIDWAGRLVECPERSGPVTGRVVSFGGYQLNDGVEFALVGQGLYGEMGDCFVPKTAAEMFEPQLGAASKVVLLENLKARSGLVGDFPDTKEYDWGLDGILIDGDSHADRKKGTLIWSGAANIFWWIDRETGVAGVFGTQIMPAGELVTKEYIRAFEDEVYAKVKKAL